MSYQGHYQKAKAPAEEKQPSSLKKKLLIIISVFLVLCLVIIGGLYWFLFSKFKKVNKVEETWETLSLEDESKFLGIKDDVVEETEPTETESTEPTKPDYGKTGKVINILLIGQDARGDNEPKLADSIILCTLNRQTKKLTLTSFLRDTFLKMPDFRDSRGIKHECGKNRINVNYALGYSWGGYADAMKMLDECIYNNFGVQIDGNLEIGFGAFGDIIEGVGGIDVELDEDEAKYMNDLGEYEQEFVVGMNHLSEWPALDYARMRHSNAADSDMKRTARQRNVITQVLKKAAKMNILELNKIADNVLWWANTDMEYNQILEYMMDVLPLLSELEIETNQIPIQGSAHGELLDIYGDGVTSAVLIPDVQANRNFLQSVIAVTEDD